jgi:hypothetical protein
MGLLLKRMPWKATHGYRVSKNRQNLIGGTSAAAASSPGDATKPQFLLGDRETQLGGWRNRVTWVVLKIDFAMK